MDVCIESVDSIAGAKVLDSAEFSRFSFLRGVFWHGWSSGGLKSIFTYGEVGWAIILIGMSWYSVCF